jgi:hypothetical protein
MPGDTRRFTASVPVKVTTVSGHTVLTESGASVQGTHSASIQQVT